MKLYAPLPLIDEPGTYLTASAAAAATAITVANNTGLVALDYTVIGLPGQKETTINKISTLTGTTVINYVDDGLSFAITENTPVTFIKYNQVRFYLGDYSAGYSTGTISVTKNSSVVTGVGTTFTGLNTTYSLLLNGKWYDLASVDSATQITLTENYVDEDMSTQTYILVGFASQKTSSIAISRENTTWDDTDALAEDYYRYDYYNSTTTLSSTKSSIFSAAESLRDSAGFSEYTLKSITDQVLSELRDPDARRRTRTEIKTDANHAIKKLISSIISDVQEDYLSTYDTIDIKADVGEYELFDDFKKLTMTWVSYGGDDYNKATSIRIQDDIPGASYQEDDPNVYLRDNLIGVKPVPDADVTSGIKVWYEKRMPSLRYDGDEVPDILKDYIRVIIDYCLEKACMADDKENKAITYRMSFVDGRREMVKGLSDRDLNTNDSIEVVNNADLYE